MGASDHVKHFTDENFETSVSNGLVLVDFYADWCGPCRMLTPIIEELATEMNGKLIVGKVDTDKAINVATKFEVTSIPTIIFFKNGQVVKRIVGLKDLDSLRKMVEQLL